MKIYIKEYLYEDNSTNDDASNEDDVANLSNKYKNFKVKKQFKKHLTKRGSKSENSKKKYVMLWMQEENKANSGWKWEQMKMKIKPICYDKLFETFENMKHSYTNLVSNMLWLEWNTIAWIVKTNLLDNIACLKENEHDVVQIKELNCSIRKMHNFSRESTYGVEHWNHHPYNS